MDLPLPNRLAVYLTGAIALLAGILPLIGNLDWESTAGVIAGLSAIAVVVREWLVNWGKWERGEGNALLPGELDDEFDEDAAEPIPAETVAAAQADEGSTYVPPVEPKAKRPPGFTG